MFLVCRSRVFQIFAPWKSVLLSKLLLFDFISLSTGASNLRNSRPSILIYIGSLVRLYTMFNRCVLLCMSFTLLLPSGARHNP